VKKNRNRLTITRETLRKLTGPDLDSIRGAVNNTRTCLPNTAALCVTNRGCDTGPNSQQPTQCAGLCTTNPWTLNCPVSE
jgi:hypothetical protein